jgi:UDP-3-O-acyl-N-acetylglucosamine deacetylase
VIDRVVPAERCTALAAGPSRVRTVEHLLAACVLAGLDNAVLSVEGEELPALDGSAAEYLELIGHVGLITLDAPAAGWRLSERVEMADPQGGRWRIEAVPSEEPSFRFRFRGGGKLDGREAAWAPGESPAAVATARTFCFEREVEALRQAGLGRGGSLENVLVLREDGSSLNEARGEDEPVRHKLLDLIGDLSLAGAAMGASILAEGTGHAVHAAFLRLLLPKLVRQEGSPDGRA